MPKEKSIKVGLIQIGDKFGKDYYLPYSIAILQAYALKNLKQRGRFDFLPPVYKRERVERILEHLCGTDIVFFSTYVWNFEISRKIAEGLKFGGDRPTIVFGGPQVPQSPGRLKEFLEKYPFLDLACYGEGEVPFLGILENFDGRNWEKVPSVCFKNAGGETICNPKAEGFKRLDHLPSAYLEGVFEPLMAANPQESWSALIETNRGCPYHCSFCYWGEKQRNKILSFDMQRVFKEIDWISAKKIEFVFCCDANFGLLGRDPDIVKKVAENKKRCGFPRSFSVQNAKNSSKKVFLLQKTLNDAGLQKGVNLALQSLNQETLRCIERSNITTDTYRRLQRMFTESRIPTFSDMIIGLPRESYGTFTGGVSDAIESGQHNRIQFINLSILENTAMSKEGYQRRYGLKVAESRAIPHHTAVEAEPEVYERQQLVVGSDSMPEGDWVKTKVFCWMTALLYFNKILQVPLIILNQLYSLRIKGLIEVFTSGRMKSPVVSGILSFFNNKATAIQKGDSEYCASKEFLNIWWPADELIFIELCSKGKLKEFYGEAKEGLEGFLRESNVSIPAGLLEESVFLNQNLIKLPFQCEDLNVELKYNIFDLYQAALAGVPAALEDNHYSYSIERKGRVYSSWGQWCRDVVWFQNKRGTYLNSCRPLSESKAQG